MNARQHQPWTWALLTAALALPSNLDAQYPPGMPLTNGYGGPLSPSPFTAYGPYSNIPYRGYGSPEWAAGGYSPPLYNPSLYGGANLPTNIYTSLPVIQPLYPLTQTVPYGGAYPGAYTGFGNLAMPYPNPTLPATDLTREPRSGASLARPGTYSTVLVTSAVVGPLGGAGGGSLSALTLSAAASSVPPSNLGYRPGPRPSSVLADVSQVNDLATRATVEVTLPASNAEVWVEGQRTHLTGTLRQFLSPPLNPGSLYAYDLRARWQENGQAISRTRSIEIRAGSIVRVDFTTP